MREANESISALLDGEVSDFELRRTLEQVGQDPQLGQQWHRYQVVRSALKRETVSISVIGSWLRLSENRCTTPVWISRTNAKRDSEHSNLCLAGGALYPAWQ